MWRKYGPSSCSERGQHRSGCLQCWPAELWASSRMKVPQFLQQPVMMLDHSNGKNISRSNWNFLYDIHMCLHCPLSDHCATSGGLCTCKSFPPLLYHWAAEAQLYHLFRPSSHIMYSSSWASWWSLVGFAPVHKYSSCTGELKTTLWSAEWRGEITTLNLMALLQLVHLVRLRQSFSSTKLHQTVVFYLSTGIPGSFLQRTKEVMKSHLGFIELNKTIWVLQPVQFFNSLNFFLKNRFLFWF